MVPLHAHSVHVGKRGRLQARRHPDSLRRSHVDLEVIIPAYNEAGRIASTLTQTVDFLAVQPWSSRIVVVDNGSVDETAAIVRRISRDKGDAVPISVLGCSRRGKGAAVRRGLLSGTSRYTGFFDADLATPLATLTEAWRNSRVALQRLSPPVTPPRDPPLLCPPSTSGAEWAARPSGL